ncbi:MAG: hypothetical protein JWP64_1043 [Pseudonocardia sp.]|uniref:hypothetical protein n=1 Tax=Pseudonocardia sp. TaxID=60912 RepID=UPI0026193364|nr:hypothetical protein [Pseudonocardia sp.]MCU1626094.1 hypothetical protein [Pseudonocardia sp.]
MNSLRDNSEYRLIMTVICVVCGLGAVGSVVPLVEQAITTLLIGLAVVAVWVTSMRLIVRMIREHLEDLEDERTAAAWRVAHQPATSLQEVP